MLDLDLKKLSMRPCFIVAITLTAAGARARPPYDRGTDLSGSCSPSILHAPWKAVRLATNVWRTKGPWKPLLYFCGAWLGLISPVEETTYCGIIIIGLLI